MNWDNPDITNKDYIMAIVLALQERSLGNTRDFTSYFVTRIAQEDYKINTQDLQTIAENIITHCNVKNAFVPTKITENGKKIIENEDYYGYGVEQKEIEAFFEKIPRRFAWINSFEFFNTFDYEDLVVDKNINVFNVPQATNHADMFKNWLIGAKFAIDKQQVAALRIYADGLYKNKDEFDATQAKRTWWENFEPFIGENILHMGTDDILRVKEEINKYYEENEEGVLEKKEWISNMRLITQQAISMKNKLANITSDTIFSNFMAEHMKIIFPFQTSILGFKRIFYDVSYSKYNALRRLKYKLIQDFRLVIWDDKTQVLYNFPDGIIPKNLKEEFNWELPETLKNDGWKVDMINSFETTARLYDYVDSTAFVQPELKFVENKRDFEAELAFIPLHREVEDELDLGIPRGYVPGGIFDVYPWDEG